MAVEERRGCGYRQVDGMYLVGAGLAIGCDRLPFPLGACPTCGAGIHFTRSMTQINALKLFGNHDEQLTDKTLVAEVSGVPTQVECHCDPRPCQVCDPTAEPAYIMMVGEKFYPTPQHFREEAHRLGVSKKIPFIPKKLKLGETVIFLAHPKAVRVAVESEDEDEGKLVKAQKMTGALGIFMAFIPHAVEMPVREGSLKGKGSRNLQKSLKRRGITPVPVPDNDKDHGPVARKPRRKVRKR